MKANQIRQTVFPLLTAFIWGTSFVAQSVSTDHIGPFTFNAARSIVAFLSLLALTFLLRQIRQRDFQGAVEVPSAARRELPLGGICCGAALTMASYFQQKGLETTTAGKSGFITALYIVIVPIAGVFLKKKAPRTVWLSVVLSLVVLGLFVICYNRIFAVTFDENFAKATGVNVGRYNIIIAVLTAVTIVLGMRMMGAMLISSLVIFPCLSSMRVFKSFGGVMVSSGLLSLACFFAGMVASYQFSIPAGASVVVVNLCAFLLFMAWQSLGRLRG